MASYLDEEKIIQRVKRHMRRRSLLAVHVILFLALCIFLIGHGVWWQQTFSLYEVNWTLWRNVGAHIGLLGILPVLLHAMWIGHQERTEQAITRELETLYAQREKQKRAVQTEDEDVSPFYDELPNQRLSLK